MKLKRTLVLSFGAGVLVMLVVAMFADFGETFGALRHMHLRWLPLLFLLSLANYVSRFARWEYFLRALGLRIPLRDSMDVFLGGFVFSVTPGKLGELFKSVLLKETHGIAIARTAPVVFAERFSDLGGLLILASLGVYGSRQGGIYWLVGMAMLVALFALLSSKRLGDLLIALIGRIGPLARRTGAAAKALESSRELLRPRELPLLILFSALCWFWECWALVFAARAFGFELGLFDATFFYSLATLAGALAFLPGGLGVTEGSMALLLVNGGMAAGQAAAATLVVRATTLWFAVGIGFFALIGLDRRWRLGTRLWSGLPPEAGEKSGEGPAKA
jgi:uncharacterized membrane protein YbhN (UPF0104 family)